jgi:4-hydroxybenzoate polyprenyltransferase
MVPDPRPALHRYLVRPFRQSRALALVVGVAVGVAALFPAEYYADPSLYEYLFLPLGVGGCTYYLAHYDLSEWNQDGLARAILRNFAMISIPMALVPDDVPLADGLVSSLTVYGVIFFAVITAVVDVVDANGDEEDGSDGDSGVDEPNHRRPASAVDAH